MNKRRVMYLRDSKNNPIGCIAISLSKDRKKVRYQVSVRNPEDHFDKPLARHIAYGRLLEKPFVVKGLIGNENLYYISLAVMNDIMDNEALPNRARRAAKVWVDYNTMFSDETVN